MATNDFFPIFAIYKPSLIGGMKGTAQWKDLCEANGIAWWITSALERNIGLNAISQWTYTLNSSLPQGLGTGGLYTNNFDCPLEVANGQIQYDPEKNWDFKF